MATFLRDSQQIVEYSVIVEGRPVYTSSVRMMAENFRNNLTPDMKAKATIVPTANGKQVLYG
jgi:hypothetical protein